MFEPKNEVQCDGNTVKRGRMGQVEVGKEKTKSCGSCSPGEEFGFKCSGRTCIEYFQQLVTST